jgi:hypothetical protein
MPENSQFLGRGGYRILPRECRGFARGDGVMFCRGRRGGWGSVRIGRDLGESGWARHRKTEARAADKGQMLMLRPLKHDQKRRIRGTTSELSLDIGAPAT